MHKSKLALILALTFLACTTESSDKNPRNKLSASITKSCFKLLANHNYDYANNRGLTKQNYGNDEDIQIAHLSRNSLCIYSASDGRLINNHTIRTEGPNSTGPISSFSNAIPINKDSILIFNNSRKAIVLHTNDTLTSIVDYTNNDSLVILGNFQNRPISSPYHYLFPVYPAAVEFLGNRKTFVAISKDLKKHRTVIPSKHLYKTAFQFGDAPYLYLPSIVFNEKSSTYVVSFPVSHDLFEYDLDFNLVKEHKLFHEEIGDISPFDGPLNEEGLPNYKDTDQYFYRTSYFQQLHYLNDSDQYVRIARKVDPETLDKSFLLIAYSGDFSAATVIPFDPDWRAYNSFANGDAFYVLNEMVLDELRNGEIPYDCVRFE